MVRRVASFTLTPSSSFLQFVTDSPSFVHAVAACFGDSDISDAPDGMYGVSFDDGVSPPSSSSSQGSADEHLYPQPLPSSPALYQFLQKQNQTATQ